MYKNHQKKCKSASDISCRFIKSYPVLSYIHSGFATEVHSYSTSEEFYQHKSNVKHAEQGTQGFIVCKAFSASLGGAQPWQGPLH